MRTESILSSIALLALSASPVRGVPAGVRRTDSAPVPAESLRGPSDLLGYFSSEVLTDEDTDDVGPYTLEPGQLEDSKIGSYVDFSNNPNPQPIRGSKGGTDPGPRSGVYEVANSDKFAPPGTDIGGTINAQWAMDQSHTKQGLDGAGWSKQENTVVMPAAKQMAGVMMRLEPGAYRELHWHVAGEWAIVLNGTTRIQVRIELSLIHRSHPADFILGD